LDNILTSAIINTLLSVTEEGIHVIDRNGVTIFYNRSMARLEGLDEDKVVNRKLLDVFPSLTEETSTLLNALNTGNPIKDKVQTYINNMGRVITTVNTTVPIKVNGKVLGAIEIARDITVLTEISEKLVLLNEGVPFNAGKNLFTFHDIVGQSSKIKTCVNLAKKVASSGSTVLLIGETGTGKELFAQSIHNASPRKNKPFIAQNCAALPESLLEGLMFGTTRGAFTGATDRPGLFEMAHNGTLLLDEINSMGFNLQAKLLRVLQDNCVRRVGGRENIPVNVRIIATTNYDPEMLVKKGELRPDLYYRLNTFPIEIPPLRERKEDIPLLISHFLSKYNRLLGSSIKKVSPEIESALNQYNWPGNVRELENVIQASANMAMSEETIRPEHLPQYIYRILTGSHDNRMERVDEYNYEIPVEEYLEQIERKILEKALAENGYNISQTARKLSTKRQLLQYKIKKYNIELNR
jgi:arginine utilization regulatory protein